MKYFLQFAALTSLLSVVGCSDPAEIGLNTQPKGDKLNVFFTDTTTLAAYTVKEDPITGSAPTACLAGSYTDPLFGKTVAGFYAQFALPSNNLVLGSGATYDSLVISFAYSGYYGDTLVKQTFDVYELAEKLNSDSTYLTDRKVATAGLIGSVTFAPHPKDSLVVDTLRRAPQLRFRLSDTFGSHMFSALTAGNITTTADFLDFFKGVYVVPNAASQDGAILYFGPTINQTKISVYYTLSGKKSLLEMFSGSGTARLNHFEHTFTGSPIVFDTKKADSLLYVQGMAGAKVKISLPYLKTAKTSSQVAINKAELIVHVDKDNAAARYPAPPSMFLFQSDSLNKPALILDQFEGSSYYGGVHDTLNNTYTFNISRHIQHILANKDYGMFLVTAGPATNAARVRLFGPGKSSATRMRLKITYTKLH